MDIKIDLERLRTRKLMVATPAYGGFEHSAYKRSMSDLQGKMAYYGLPFEFQGLYNESLITRGRNTLAAQFLRTDCTDLMFIDADIEFNPIDVLALWHLNLPLVGGAYPLKGLDWGKIKAAVLSNPDIDPAALPAAGSKFVVHFLTDTITAAPLEPIECAELGTGFMLVARSVLEKLTSSRPSYSVPEGGVHHDFFPVGVHEGRYESEDYGFCRLAREAGFKVHVCPWMQLTHHGSFGFTGNMGTAILELNEVN